MNVYERILAVQKAIRPVPKNGTLEVNGRKQYDFVKDADVLMAVKELANEAGLVITASQESGETGFFEVTSEFQGKEKRSTRRYAKVRMLFCVVNVEKPEDKVESYFEGYAEDTGDKAVTKAITSAGKYFHLKFFGVPTGDDLEADPAVHEPSNLAPKHRPASNGYAPNADTFLDAQLLKTRITQHMNNNKLTPASFLAKTGAAFSDLAGITDQITLQDIYSRLTKEGAA